MMKTNLWKLWLCGCACDGGTIVNTRNNTKNKEQKTKKFDIPSQDFKRGTLFNSIHHNFFQKPKLITFTYSLKRDFKKKLIISTKTKI